jgi:hypothetical protein
MHHHPAFSAACGSAGALLSGVVALAAADPGSRVLAVLGLLASVAVPISVAWLNRQGAVVARDLKIAGLERRVEELREDLRKAREAQTGPPR